MPRLHGKRERRHQPFYDSITRTTGAPATAINSTGSLFGNANVGTTALTNLQVAGQLASDQTYIILALRCYLYFNGTNRRANYLRVSSQLWFTLFVGDKPMFQCPAWYFPQGGGIWGYDSGTSVFCNGVPTQEAILKLAKPITVPVRQNFKVDWNFYVMGAATDALVNLNTGATNDEKCIQFYIDGVQTRDVQ